MSDGHDRQPVVHVPIFVDEYNHTISNRDEDESGQEQAVPMKREKMIPFAFGEKIALNRKPVVDQKPDSTCKQDEVVDEKDVEQKVRDQFEDALKKLADYRKQVADFRGAKTDKQYKYLNHLLEKLVHTLDKIDTGGNSELRAERKSIIGQVQELNDDLDDKTPDKDEDNKRDQSPLRAGRSCNFPANSDVTKSADVPVPSPRNQSPASQSLMSKVSNSTAIHHVQREDQQTAQQGHSTSPAAASEQPPNATGYRSSDQQFVYGPAQKPVACGQNDFGASNTHSHGADTGRAEAAALPEKNQKEDEGDDEPMDDNDDEASKTTEAPVMMDL